jgi:hypothetical protein
LAGHRAAGDRGGEARALARLGVVHERLGDYDQAGHRMREALALYRMTGNRHGEGTEPPEFINQCGPYMWGLCFYDDAANNPGVFAEDDDIDWLWREMITFGPAIQEPNAITSDPQWMQVSVGPTGLRDSKGQRKLNQAPAFLHWCFDLPNSFSSTAPGISWEVMVHTIWTVL